MPADVKPDPGPDGNCALPLVASKPSPGLEGRCGKELEERAGGEMVSKCPTLVSTQWTSHACVAKQTKSYRHMSAISPTSSSALTLSAVHMSQGCQIARKTSSSISSVTVTSLTATVEEKQLTRAVRSVGKVMTATDLHPTEV